MGNPEALSTLSTQVTGHITLEKNEWAIKNGQSRETGNIGYTRQINVREYQRGNQKGTIQRNWQHRVHKTKYTLENTEGANQ